MRKSQVSPGSRSPSKPKGSKRKKKRLSRWLVSVSAGAAAAGVPSSTSMRERSAALMPADTCWARLRHTCESEDRPTAMVQSLRR